MLYTYGTIIYRKERERESGRVKSNKWSFNMAHWSGMVAIDVHKKLAIPCYQVVVAVVLLARRDG